MQACARYKYVDSHCVCAVSFLLLRILSSKTIEYAHKYTYTTTLLPPASAQAVLAGENPSCDVSTLGVPVHCAQRHRCSPLSLISGCANCQNYIFSGESNTLPLFRSLNKCQHRYVENEVDTYGNMIRDLYL